MLSFGSNTLFILFESCPKYVTKSSKEVIMVKTYAEYRQIFSFILLLLIKIKSTNFVLYSSRYSFIHEKKTRKTLPNADRF